MKIAFLIQDITTAGGTERTTCCLAAELARRGHDVHIVSVFRTEQEPRYRAEGVTITYLSNETYGMVDGAFGRLMKIIGCSGSARRCEVLEDADVIICQRLVATLLAVRAGYGPKSVACEHFRYAMYSTPIRRARRELYKRVRAVVTLTEKDRGLFMEEGLEHVYCIANMVSVSPLPYQGAGSRRIISVGRLTAQKGYDLLLEAVARVADRLSGWHIDIYGEGEAREALEAQCRRLGLSEMVHLRGYSNCIEQEYAHSALYVMSSRFEGFPMVLLEAAACGLPIVSFDCPEGPRVLLREGGGLLVPGEDTQALGEALVRMTSDEALRALCHKQTTDVVAPYRPECIGEKWENLLDTLSDK